MPFGSGPASFRGVIQMTATDVDVFSADFYTSRLFRDAAGGVSAGPAVEYEFRREGQRVDAGSVPDEDRILESSRWRSTPPGSGAPELVLRSNGHRVAGAPSVTTVRAALDADRVSYDRWSGPAWFAVVAAGGPAEEIVFGRDRDPHVELALEDLPADHPVWLDLRPMGAAEWTPLAVTSNGLRLRAKLPAGEGDFALRARIGSVNGSPPLEMRVEPAYRGRRSPATNAQLLAAGADASGAHVEWRVDAAGERLLVERRDPGADWQEHGDVLVDPDGVARYRDTAVLGGARYGYRLMGSTAEVHLRVPASGAAPALAFSVAPNPTARDVIVALSLERVSTVTLSLHDLQGRRVRSQRLDSAAPGMHVVNLTAGARPPAGLYFVRLERDGDERVRRVTLIP
jgi:hypothetical protein